MNAVGAYNCIFTAGGMNNFVLTAGDAGDAGD